MHQWERRYLENYMEENTNWLKCLGMGNGGLRTTRLRIISSC
jgi:hypothetical protein